MRSRTIRRGFTLVEMLFTLLLVTIVVMMVYNFWFTGQRTMSSTSRKLEAIRFTHLRFEEIRHDLECCQFAWAPKPAEEDAAGSPSPGRELGGGPVMFAGQKEYLFKASSGRLYVCAAERSGEFVDVRFWGQDDFLLKFAISCDCARIPPTHKPVHRERSTLVSKVFIEPQAENCRRRNHVYEEGHVWCIAGAPIHYAFED